MESTKPTKNANGPAANEAERPLSYNAALRSIAENAAVSQAENPGHPEPAILKRLDRVRRARNGWTARCPAHDDKNPSLSITKKDGKTLLKCHAGCETEAIVKAVGLTMPDLFDKPASQAEPQCQPVTTYDYTDKNGALLFQVCRTEPKGFFQRRPDGNGGWINGLGDTARVLYRLPEVIKAESVIICEGEKDVETACTLGLSATCNPHGAGKWKPEYSESLKGKTVSIIADADEPGRKHARQVAASLSGIAASVKMPLELPGAKDLTEWIARSDGQDLDGAKEQLLALTNQQPEVTVQDVEQWRYENADEIRQSGTAKRPVFSLTSWHDMFHEPEEQELWVWDNRLPLMGVSMLVAKPKVGKSTFARDLALSVATGQEFLGQTVSQGTVVYLAHEERRLDVKAHLNSLGADAHAPIYIHCGPADGDAFEGLEEIIQSRKPQLVVIDPLSWFTRFKDINDYSAVTNTLQPLIGIARKYKTHLMCLHHARKGHQEDAQDGLLGSTALAGIVDTLLFMGKDGDTRTLQSIQRQGESMAETMLHFDPARRKFTLGVSRTQAEADELESAILDYLRDENRPRTEKEVMDSVSGDFGKRRKALRDLVASGRVVRNGAGKRGDPFLYSFSFEVSSPRGANEKRETEKTDKGRINTGSILVCDDSNENPHHLTAPEAPAENAGLCDMRESDELFRDEDIPAMSEEVA